MSLGIKSGVICTRRKSIDKAAAMVRTSSVFAVPGDLPTECARAKQTDQREVDDLILTVDDLGDFVTNLLIE